MKKYKDLSTITELQNKIDQKYGRGKYHAFFILLLFMCLTFTSCANDKTPAQEQAERQQQEQRTQQNQRTAGTRITITNTGQIRELEEEPVDLNDGLQRIRRAYFAKKTVTQNGTQVNFEQINDTIVGKVVYLVLETNNMVGMDIDVVIRPADATLTGSTDTLTVMHLRPPTEANQQQTTIATQIITTTVGNLDALNNNQGSRTHYTNLATYNNNAIIKLRLCPATRTVFNTWAQNLGTGTANLEIVVERNDNNLCAYGDSDEEVAGAGTFLNEDTGENHRFSVSGKNFYEIYHGSNNYNFFPNTTFQRNNTARTIRRRLGHVENNQSIQIVYYYYDIYDNEHLIREKTLSTIRNKRRVGAIPVLTQRGQLLRTVSYSENRQLGEDIDAIRLEIYENGTLGVDYRSTANNSTRNRWYANQNGNSKLVNMDDLNIPLPQVRTVGHIFREFDYDVNGVRIQYGFMNTRRRHIRMDLYAGLLGALAQFRQEGHEHYIVSQGFSYEDGSCFPSAEHINGEAGDLNYLSTYQDGRSLLLQSADFDYDNQVILCNILVDYGFQTSRSEDFSNTLNTSTGDNTTTRLPNSRHTTTPRHNNHLHIFDFRQIPNIYA